MQVIRAAAALVALCLAATGGRAAEPFTYKFTPGKVLNYRTVLLSEGSFTLPDGSPRTMKLEALSTLRLTPAASGPKGCELASETLRTRTLMDGRDVPAPTGLEKRRTLTVAPNGAIEGGADQTFAVVFPDRPLARGDTFVEERAATAAGLPLKTTFTVVDTQLALAGYPTPVVELDAKATLPAPPKDRKVTLRSGGGKVFFDPVAGVLVKSQLAYSFTEEVAMPGAPAPSVRQTTIRYTSDLVK